ncbi:MAG: hypothetical protein H6837_16630 [Planctomycetes bacterium]|nr:hypothetical protein [Planctomycetota bacterium]
MSIIKKLFGRGDEPADDPPSMPWDQRPSIYDHIRAHVDEAKPGLTDGGDTLPDEARIASGSRIRWAAGAMDGVMGHHMGQGDNDELVRKAVDLILAYCQSPTAKTKGSLYQHVIEGNTLPLIDPIIEKLIETEGLNHDRLYELARSFVTEAPDREPVKFGIAILGLYQNPDNAVLFQNLGRHEEFTLFAAVALARNSDYPEQALWSLAKNVNGWGRIHIVERLSDTENPEIKNWLLREGYKNWVMYEYLAYTCATAGCLLAALSEDAVDRELLTSSGELLAALISGGPAQDINDYEDGALATELFLGHLESAAETLGDFIHVQAIRGYLVDEKADWEERSQRGWTEERRAESLAACDRILNLPEWPDKARVGLGGDDEMDFHRANQVAEALGLDTWDTHWHRLQEKPLDSGRWYQVMARCKEDRLADVIAFAEQNIDLEKIATGPADEMGLGPGWEHHQCLDYVLQELRKFPGQGSRLIQSGLRSPVVRNRNMAVAALAAWEQEHWDDALRSALETAAKIEPVVDVRKRMENVSKGVPLGD